jgi:hypothetical protein
MTAGTVLVLFACSAASGQQADKMPSFEVVSIKPEPPHRIRAAFTGVLAGRELGISAVTIVPEPLWA